VVSCKFTIETCQIFCDFFVLVIVHTGWHLFLLVFLCSLSVTKWIHLNWGDDGIITLFVKIWSLLRPVYICVFGLLGWAWVEPLWSEEKLTIPCILSFGFSCFQGGVFIMEPQPWISYKKNRSVSEVYFDGQSDNWCYIILLRLDLLSQTLKSHLYFWRVGTCICIVLFCFWSLV
jgi:hypothetical protein